VVAGPAVSDINLVIPLDANIAAGQARAGAAVEEHLQKTRRAAARKARPRAVPLLESDPPVAQILTDDLFEIPHFLKRCRLIELEEAA
jgi:hypothetical protein